MRERRYLVEGFGLSTLLSGATFEDIQPHISAEARNAWRLYKGGQLREYYLRADDEPGVLFAFECEDVAQAGTLVNTFPMVKAGVIDFDLIPVGPLLSLDALFAT